MRKILALLILAVLVFSAPTVLNLNFRVLSVKSAIIWTVGPPASGANFTSIQDAINAASEGDTIDIWAGNYTENVIVNKSVNLYGAGSDVTDLIASDPNLQIFNITANNVNLTGFKIRAATGATGVYLTRANYTKLANNLFESNQNGIHLYVSSNCTISANNMKNISSYGVYLFSSFNNSFTSNIITGGTVGIDISSSSNYNDFTSNNITSSGSYGVVLSSSNNSFTGNNITGVSVGVYLVSSSNNSFTSNTISGDKGVLLSFSSNYNNFTSNTISNSSRCVSLSSSSNNMFTSNIITGGTVGIDLEDSSDHNCFTSNNLSDFGGDGVHLNSSHYNVLSWNSIKNSTNFGIFLVSSNNNNISSNNATGNSQGGIQIDANSNLNTIYNNYFSNTLNAQDDGHNKWNITKTTSLNIVGGPYLGGNYWSDYMGADTNNDTFGDTLLPYNCEGNITSGGDWLPLTPPTFQYIGDLNVSGTIYPMMAASNSTITGFSSNSTTFCFNVSGTEGTPGYCALIVPIGLNLSDYAVYINGTVWPYTLSSNGTHYYIHFTYTHSQSEITVQSPGGFVPEFPFFWIPIVVVAAALIFWTYKGRRKNHHFFKYNPIP